MTWLKLYRWWKGGRWVKHENKWYLADVNGYIRGECLSDEGRPSYFSCHADFKGNQAVEDYRAPYKNSPFNKKAK
jgi:hypothetical protein